MFSSTAIENIKWVTKFAVAQAKVTHILRPGKASEKTPKGVIPPSLCEISHTASRKKIVHYRKGGFLDDKSVEFYNVFYGGETKEYNPHAGRKVYIIEHMDYLLKKDVGQSSNHATSNTLWVSGQPDLLHKK
jgi:hypothetical protein